MRGLILSGGSGTRLRPLTHSNAKQLLPVANTPILHRAIRDLVKVGIVEIGVVVGDTAQQVIDSVGDGSSLGARVEYIRQDQPLGLAHCVKISRSFLGDANFVMFLGDNVFEAGLDSFVTAMESSPTYETAAAHVAVKRVSNPSAYGVAVVGANGALEFVEEKPSRPRSDLALVGTYLFTPAIHLAIDSIVPSARGELEITDAIQYLIDAGKQVGVSEVDGWWFDTGNPASFLECNKKLLDLEGGEVLSEIPPGVQIIPPCSIDDNVILSNCTIGPYVSLGSGVVVNGVDLQSSVVLPSVSITGSGSVKHSIVGARCSVAIENGVAAQIVLGDDCSIEVGK